MVVKSVTVLFVLTDSDDIIFYLLLYPMYPKAFRLISHLLLCVNVSE